MNLTELVVIGGAALFGLYLLGRLTPESRMNQPLIETSAFPEWAKLLALIVVIGAGIIWFFGGR